MFRMVAIFATEEQSIKQLLLRVYKIAFMVSMRYIGCVMMCIIVFVRLQVRIKMVAKGCQGC